MTTLPTFEDLVLIRPTKVVLATAHRDHDTANNRPAIYEFLASQEASVVTGEVYGATGGDGTA